MYEQFTVLAIFVFIYSIIAGRVERSLVSGPMVFVAAGFLFGPLLLGWFYDPTKTVELRVIADLTLALVLFTDAANSDRRILKLQLQLPARMLLLGLPGIIALGFGVAVLLFDGLTIFEAAILATMLAATDAALGKTVVSDEVVPARIREALNAESGLNDGLCVPILLVFITLAEGSTGSSGSAALVMRFVTEELGIGLAVGLSVGGLGALGLKFCWQRDWVTPIWKQVTVVAIAFAAFALAQTLHGSGYIAAFSGGMLFGSIAKDATPRLVLAAEGTADTLALVTWLIFGATVVGQAAEFFTWQVVVYAILSLTVVRMVPIFLSLTGTSESTSSKLFLGWFGPRGLVSIVFAIIVLNKGLPGGEVLALVVTCTVLFSLIAHGITANPMAKWLGNKESTEKG